MSSYQKYLDPGVLSRLSGLELQARLIVEGFVTGMHESPYKGVSVEFAQHREYVPGDDLRHLDWKVFARTDRLYVKEYEQETNLRVNLIVDTSTSMDFGSWEVTKLEYSKYVAASLAYMVSEQQDAVGLITFDNEINNFITPSTSTAHFHSIIKVLSDLNPEERTDLGGILNEAAGRITNRGLTIVISDYFDDLDGIKTGLNRLRHQQHDVIVMQVLDPFEVNFPMEQMTRFEGMEIPDELLADPKALRDAYLEEIQSHNDEIRKTCLGMELGHRMISTDENLGVALSEYLARRMSMLKRSG